MLCNVSRSQRACVSAGTDPAHSPLNYAMESWEDLEVGAAVHPSSDGRHQSESSPQGSYDGAQALDMWMRHDFWDWHQAKASNFRISFA